MADTKSTIALEIKVNGEAATASVGSFKKQLKDANNELLNMSAKFGETSKEAVNAAQKVAKLKDSIGDAKALADTFNPDKKFVALGGALQGATAGFSALQGAMGLFGSEGKEVEKALLKVQSAMALQQGISGIAGAMDSFKMLGNEIKGNLVKAFSTLKGAIAATGIGLLVVGVGLLVANFEKVKEVMTNLFPALSKITDFFGKMINAVTDFVGVTSEAERATNRMISAADKSIDKNKKFLQEHGDEIDQYTKRKIDAEISYNEAIKVKGADQVEMAKRLNRELAQADVDRRKQINADAKAVKDKNDKDAEAAKIKRQAATDKYFEDARKQGAKDLEIAAAKIKDEQEQIKKEELLAASKVTISSNAAIAVRDATKMSVEQTDALKKKYNDIDLADAKILQDAKVKATLDTLNIVSDILGKESAAGKAMAISMALINTYQGIAAGVKLGFPLAIPAVLAAAATGFKAVKSIIATKLPNGGGGSGGGGSAPSMGSIAAPIKPEAQTTTLSTQSINQIGVASSRAFVLETDVTNNQERIQRLNRAARIN
jgi:hypothetical protein